MAEPLRQHVRIDEGMKRGPRKKPGPKPSSPRHDNGQFIPTLPNDPESIRKALEDYCSGATLKQIGDKHGVTRQAVYGWLLGELGGEQHSSLVTRALTARIAKGDETLDIADNPLDLQRGREQARNARLDLERRRASLYGAKTEMQVNVDHNHEISQALETRISDLILKIRDQVQPIDVQAERIEDKT